MADVKASGSKGGNSDKRIRPQAAKALVEILDQRGYASLVIDRTLKQMDQVQTVQERDRRWFSSLIYETVRHHAAIDQVIGACSKTPLNKMKPYVRACLRMGVTQLFYMEGVKPYAAVSESVNLVKKAGFQGLASFVNGVLRGVQRMGKPEEAEEEKLPEWIKASIRSDYGPLWEERYIRVLSSVRPICLRMNLTKGSREELLEEVRAYYKNGTDTEPILREGNLSGAALYVDHVGNIAAMPLYTEGKISVQDESSMTAVVALDPQKGETILDLCAAPGGKSAYAAERMEDQGAVISRDIHLHRVKLIEEGAARLGLSVIHASVGDAMVPLEEDRERFDRVLLDAPCSGLGIVRSKQDIAEHRSEEDIHELSHMQEVMLETAARALKPGGRLVYSTCTLTKEENDHQVEKFLEKHPEFHLLDLKEELKESIPSWKEEEAILNRTITLWPVENGHDGFFVAALMKE